MKIRELIKKLKKMKRKHGNKEIDIYNTKQEEFLNLSDNSLTYWEVTNSYSIEV